MGLAIEIDTSLPARRVVRVLDRLGELRGLPGASRMDNGPELIAQELVDWCDKHDVIRVTFNQANQIRMPTSSATTVASETQCSTSTRSRVSSKCARSALNGVGCTTKRGLMTRSEDLPSAYRIKDNLYF